MGTVAPLFSMLLTSTNVSDAESSPHSACPDGANDGQRHRLRMMFARGVKRTRSVSDSGRFKRH